MKCRNGTGKSWKGRSEVVLEASGMEKICCILLVCMFYIMQSVSACQSQRTSGSAGTSGTSGVGPLEMCNF